MGVGLEVPGLAAGGEVGVDDEPAGGVELLEVDDAGGDTAGGEGGGGEGAGLWVGDEGLLVGLRLGGCGGGCLLGLGEPGVELGDWGCGVEVGAVKLPEGELLGLAVGLGTCGGDYGGGGVPQGEGGRLALAFFFIWV